MNREHHEKALEQVTQRFRRNPTPVLQQEKTLNQPGDAIPIVTMKNQYRRTVLTDLNHHQFKELELMRAAVPMKAPASLFIGLAIVVAAIITLAILGVGEGWLMLAVFAGSIAAAIIAAKSYSKAKMAQMRPTPYERQHTLARRSKLDDMEQSVCSFAEDMCLTLRGRLNQLAAAGHPHIPDEETGRAELLDLINIVASGNIAQLGHQSATRCHQLERIEKNLAAKLQAGTVH